MFTMDCFFKHCSEIFVYLLLLSCATCKLKPSPNLCSESSVCECKKVGSIYISCEGIDSLSDVQILLDRFQNESVGQLHLQNTCTIEDIPSKAFQNSTISLIFFECPLKNISDDAFEGVKGLISVTLQKTSFTRLPKAIESNKGIQHLVLWDGDLRELKHELRNLTALHTLSLRNNAITSISDDAFITLVNLKKLDLSCNKLTVLNPNLLDTVKYLRNLNISVNHLSSIGDLVRKLELTILDIHGNNLTDFDVLFHTNLMKMQQLFVGENPLSRITSGNCGGSYSALRVLDVHKLNLGNKSQSFFLCFSHLEQLILSDNNMSSIYLPPVGDFFPRGFRSFSTLLVLRLDNNRFESIDGVFNNSVPRLNELYLNNNDIEVLGKTLRSLHKLEILDLSHNRIHYVLKDDFYNLGGLKRLDLSHNKILWISHRSFFVVSSLEILDLTSNNISSMNGSVQHLPYLSEIFLSNNEIQIINSSEFVGLPNLQNCSLSHNQIDSLEGAFKSLPSLTRVLLDNNNLETLSEDTFSNLELLQKVSFQGNKWNCDCRLIWLRNWLSSANSTAVEDTPRCHQPMSFQNTPITTLTVEDLTEWREDCPDPCRCECIEGNNFFVRANCSDRGLKDVPQLFPYHTRELNLKGNRLRNIGHLANLSFDSLTTMNLEANAIDKFPMSLPKNLKVLLLAENKITRFNLTAVRDLSLQKTTLSKNPWICDCETLDFKNWLLSKHSAVADINETLCGPKQENTHFSNKVIVHLLDDELCPSDSQFYIDLGKVVFALLVVAIALTVVYIRFKVRIKVWMYAHGFSFVKEADFDRDKEFDAFVSYSPLDENFFTNFKEELQAREPEMCLCSSENFIYDSLIIETITKAVKASKRTILILSENFLKSEWCTVEFKVAYQQELEDKIHRLVVIKYGEIPPDGEADPTLREYLDTTTYLNWGEKYFWDKLLYALPKKRKTCEKDVPASANE